MGDLIYMYTHRDIDERSIEIENPCDVFCYKDDWTFVNNSSTSYIFLQVHTPGTPINDNSNNLNIFSKSIMMQKYTECLKSYNKGTCL